MYIRCCAISLANNKEVQGATSTLQNDMKKQFANPRHSLAGSGGCEELVRRRCERGDARSKEEARQTENREGFL